MHQTLVIKDEQRSYETRFLDATSKARLEDGFAQSITRLIMVDFDGTIAPISVHPDRVEPSQRILSILNELTNDPSTTVVVVSGRSRSDLDKWFGRMRVSLVAEHGAWIKEVGDVWKMPVPITGDWKVKLLPTMKTYVDKLPGSSLEEKEFAIVFHYRAANPELSSVRAKELATELTNQIVNTDLQVLIGKKTLEVKSSKVDKGTAAQRWASKNGYDFILSIGDDRTDEDVFKTLKEGAITIRVGIAPSRAKYYLRNQSEVVQLFERLHSIKRIDVIPTAT